MMSKRTVITSFVAFILAAGLIAVRSAESSEVEGDGATNIITASGSLAGESGLPGKGGNRLVRVFKKPFKAFAKLFGEHGAKDKTNSPTETEGITAEASAPKAGRTAGDYLKRGKALLDKGRFDEAIASLNQAASLGSSEANTLLGAAFNRKRQPERATESYEQALRAAPNDPQTLNNLGYSLYLMGNDRAAVDWLKRAAKYAPNDQRVLNNLALAQSRLGKYDDAFKNFTRAEGEFAGRIHVATLLERTGRDEEALKHYEAARRLQPTSSAVLQRLIDLYQRMGKLDKAEVARGALSLINARGKWVRMGSKTETTSVVMPLNMLPNKPAPPRQ